MKRYLSLLLAVMLLWCVSACGSKTSDTDAAAGTVQPGVTENDAAGQVQTGTDGEAATQDEFAPGSVSGGVYTNEFAGIGCKLDDSWSFYTAQQIDELNGMLADGAQSESVKTMLSENRSTFDMYAVSTDGLMTMSVAFQNLGLLSGATVSAQEYVELASAELSSTLQAYGYEDVSVQVTTADFVGKTACPAVTVAAQRSGTKMYERLICLKTGNYVYCVTLCSFTEDVTEEMAALFYAL